MRAVLSEESGETISERTYHRRRPVRHITPQKQKCAEAGQQGMQQQFELNAAGSDTDHEERPVERIPGADLWIGEERKSGEDVRRPEWHFARAQMIGKIFLRGVVD